MRKFDFWPALTKIYLSDMRKDTVIVRRNGTASKNPHASDDIRVHICSHLHATAQQLKPCRVFMCPMKCYCTLRKEDSGSRSWVANTSVSYLVGLGFISYLGTTDLPYYYFFIVIPRSKCRDSSLHLGNDIFLPHPFASSCHLMLCRLTWTTKIVLRYTECPRRNVPDFGRVFLMLKYTDITQNTYVQIWTVTEIMAREKCGLLAGPRTVPVSWRSYPYPSLSVVSYYGNSAHARCKLLMYFLLDDKVVYVSAWHSCHV